jgi:hypothetical protein
MIVEVSFEMSLGDFAVVKLWSGALFAVTGLGFLVSNSLY